MGEISGHDLTLSHDCATPGCLHEADASGLCRSCRGTVSRNGTAPVRFESTGLRVEGELDFEQWRALLRRLTKMEGALSWWLGDVLALGDCHWRAEWAGVLDELGIPMRSARDWLWVSRAVAPEVRRETLSYSHHRAVAKLVTPDQDSWLERAERERMSVNRLEATLRREALSTPTQPSPDLELVQLKVFAAVTSVARWREAAGERGVSLSALAVEALELLTATP